jgi:hypothetical protein
MPEHGMFKLNGNKYMVKNIDTGKINAKSTTKAKAKKQMNLLNSIDKGFMPGRRNA